MYIPKTFKELSFQINENTVVTIVVAWLRIEEACELEKSKSFLVDQFSWFYIGSMNLWGIFVIMLYFSKYSQIKLGQPDDKPEYNDVTWFVMLFACGIGVGMFFYGVAEPVYHYVGANRYVNIVWSSAKSTSQMLYLCVDLTN